jgi:hypothetical protein
VIKMELSYLRLFGETCNIYATIYVCGWKETSGMKIERDNGNMRCHPHMNNYGSWSVEMGQESCTMMFTWVLSNHILAEMLHI